MKTLYFIRHGLVDNPEHVFYSEDFPLGETGKKQMRSLAEQLKNAGCLPHRIVASTHERTRESAQILADSFDTLHPEFDQRLVEWKVGDWIGKPLEDFRTAAGYHQKLFSLKLNDIESYEDAAARVQATALDVLESIPDMACAIIVSHREPMVAAILKWQCKPDWSQIPELDFLPGTCWKLVFDQHNAFISAEKAFPKA